MQESEVQVVVSKPSVKWDPRAIDISGQRFGRLKVIGPVLPYGKAQKWQCICDCGNTREIKKSGLKGMLPSCGCADREDRKRRATTHGLTKTHAYHAWRGMRARCEKETDKKFPLYGARGIRVCERWKHFETFLSDMGHPPQFTSLDRIDVNGNYEPSNCRWADIYQQNNNKRTNLRLEARGEIHTAAEWSRLVGIRRHTIYSRIRKGWCPEEAIFGR